MRWEDVVFSGGSVIFIAALLPSLRPRSPKPHWLTSVITAITLSAYSATFLTMGLMLSAALAALSAILWYWMGLAAPSSHVTGKYVTGQIDNKRPINNASNRHNTNRPVH